MEKISLHVADVQTHSQQHNVVTVPIDTVTWKDDTKIGDKW